MRPKILVLYCGAGGGSVGYAQAGFDVVGVDLFPQPNNPAFWTQDMKDAHGVGEADFTFVQSDALAYMDSTDISKFKAIHASPPCQAYSWSAKRWTNIERADLVAPTRERLIASGLPYVIENVVGAPLVNPATLCGISVGLPELIRHRLFETNWPFVPTTHIKHVGTVKDGTYITVAGHGGDNIKGRGSRADKQRAMGVDWMSDKELNESVPPAYLRYVGRQLMEHLTNYRKFYEEPSKELFDDAKSRAKRQENLSYITSYEWRRGTAFLTSDRTAGYFLSDTGDLRNVFNYGQPGMGAHAVQNAISRGAKSLDCFDGYLVDFYGRMGFVEVERIPFNDDYAPDGWDYESLGRPDVVIMEVGVNFVQRVESIALQSAYDLKVDGWKTMYILFNTRPRYEYWDYLLDHGYVTPDVYRLAEEYYEWSEA